MPGAVSVQRGTARFPVAGDMRIRMKADGFPEISNASRKATGSMSFDSKGGIEFKQGEWVLLCTHQQWLDGGREHT